MHRVVATAGHVDHGKSTLVRALTGIEPDRWAEERRRGLTVDLGFAWTTLASGTRLGFVDVPGHQRFIANMLAGIGPAPAVLFVVAADGGWSAQSADHLAAIDALGVRHGLLAVTRSDLADAAPARSDALRRLAHSSLGAVPSVVVSARTGEGMDDLRVALDELVPGLPQPDDTAPIRLWVDRSFSLAGAGTVITGTLTAGTVAVGDRLERDGAIVTVRGVQSAGEHLDRTGGVRRIALNLRGVTPSEIGRGDAVLTPGAWPRGEVFDARVWPGGDPGGTRSTRDARDLPTELVLHAGTAAVPARLRALDERHVRITLARALPLRAGDRAVLRDPGRRAVAAGALVLDADPPALTRRGAARAWAVTLRGASGVPDVGAEVARRGVVARAHLDRLGVDTSAVADESGWLVDAATRAGWGATAAATVAAWAQQHPLDPAMPDAALARALDVPLELLGGIVRAAGLASGDGRVGRTAPALPAGVRTLIERLRADPFRAPEAGELVELGVGRRELAAAERAGALCRIGGVVLLPDVADAAIARLRTLPQPFSLSAARRAMGTTRRVAVPLLEHLDRLGRTIRVDDTRRALVTSDPVR